MERIVQIVTEKSVRKAVTRSGDGDLAVDYIYKYVLRLTI